jgi:glycosyltransferase involved in cell wall biosynthesis
LHTTVVIPCYNEAERLNREEFLRFAAATPDVRLLLVNDGSQDDTLKMLRSLAAAIPQRIGVLNLERNGGKAEAVRQGVMQALAEKTELVGYWDADLATPLMAIDDFRRVLARHRHIDLVIGSRMPLLGHRIRRHPLRRILGRSFAAVAARVLGMPICDTQCGAKMFRVTADTAALFAEPLLAGWIFDVELLARWISLRSHIDVTAAVYELPLDAWEDVPGSRLRPRHFVRAVGELAGIYGRHLAPWSPRYVARLPAGDDAPTVPLPTPATNTHDSSSQRAA